jgi:hypothetical protein
MQEDLINYIFQKVQGLRCHYPNEISAWSPNTKTQTWIQEQLVG